MTAPLNVLVVESDPGAAVLAREDLEAAGHSVFQCHQPGSAPFPCNGVAEGSACPLEAAVVDVVLDVRASPRPQPTPYEDGVTCALRHRVPVVVAGRVALSPFDEYATDVAKGAGGVVAACERAAGAALREHSKVATVALTEVLRRHGSIDQAYLVRVTRREGSLLVDVSGRGRLDHMTMTVAAARMVAAVRAIDRHARNIDVNFQTE